LKKRLPHSLDMENRTVHWSVTTSTLIGERVAGIVLWITALLIIGVVAILMPKILWAGIVVLIIFVWKLISFLRLRRVHSKLKAVRLVAEEFLTSAQPFTFQFELDTSDHLDVEGVSLVCEWRSQGSTFWVNRLPLTATPVVSSGQSMTFSVSGVAPVLTRSVTVGLAIWFVRVKILGADYSFPLQLKEPRLDTSKNLIGVPK
jgi:hypothetical protein